MQDEVNTKVIAIAIKGGKITAEVLEKALKTVVPGTYNQMSVDLDTSTNDTLIIMASGLAGNPEICEENADFQGWQDIQMGERLAWSDMAGTGAGSKAPGSSQTGAPKPPKAKSSTRRWVCPKCGTIIRSTKEVRVICADCMELFVKAE